MRPLCNRIVFRCRESLSCISFIATILINLTLNPTAILLVDVTERHNGTIIQALSDIPLVSCQGELERQHLLASDNMRQERIHVLEEHTFLALAESKACWHAVYYPRARLD